MMIYQPLLLLESSSQPRLHLSLQWPALSTLRTERIVQDGRRLTDSVGYDIEWTSAPSYPTLSVSLRPSCTIRSVLNVDNAF